MPPTRDLARQLTLDLTAYTEQHFPAQDIAVSARPCERLTDCFDVRIRAHHSQLPALDAEARRLADACTPRMRVNFV